MGDADNDDCPPLKFTVAHLEGEAANWYEDNKATLTRWKMGNVNNRMAEKIVTRFNTAEKIQGWQWEFYSLKQNNGEIVENYAQRFRKLAKKVGMMF
jgi:hypothetical protein